jgi:hypothetical protein
MAISSEQDTVYITLTGRKFDTAQLSSREQQLLEKVTALFQRSAGWEEFTRAWTAAGKAMLWKDGNVPVGHPAYRICQDLATRRGIAEGRVACPDYRDQLADLIEERFGSRYRFCKAAGNDPAHLCRVLAGEKHFSTETLFKALDDLDVQFALIDRSGTEPVTPNLHALSEGSDSRVPDDQRSPYQSIAAPSSA